MFTTIRFGLFSSLQKVTFGFEQKLIPSSFFKGGCLKNRLEDKQNPPTQQLKESFGRGLCEGMAYLEEFCVIHRDLAARNCLLDQKNVLKIADFGLSVKDSPLVIIKSGKIPVRWMAPETLIECMYTSKSDVWSYGVVLFEIWANGETPYSDLSVKDTYSGVRSNTIKLRPPKGGKNCLCVHELTNPTTIVFRYARFVDKHYEFGVDVRARKTSDIQAIVERTFA